MPLLARMVPFPLTVDVRSGAVSGLDELLADRRLSPHGHVAVAVGPGQGEQIVETVGPALQNADMSLVEGGTLEAAQQLAASVRNGSYDAVVGIGGGRTLDVAKYAATLTGLPMVAVATSLAHDGLASPVASLEHEGGKGSYGVAIPLAVVVDLDYVRRCPPEQLRSGIGDALSNLSALADWELAARERGEPTDGVAAALARTGAEALLHRTDSVQSDEFLTTLAQALVLGGLSMAIAGSSRPCSGACHEIAHAVEAEHPGQSNHGAQVAVGALFASWLRGDEVVGALDACLRRYEVPRVPADLGLSEAEFSTAVLRAPSTRPERYTILEHLELGEAEIQARVAAFVEEFA
jgi:glycerol-1-phosphate dehydrogenase [NAD(P)+]